MRAGLYIPVAAAAWMALAVMAHAQALLPERLRELVKQLDAEDYAAREEATSELIAAGEAGIESLAEGVSSASPEVAWRASESLQEIAIAGNEQTLNRVVAALDKLSKNGKPGLSNVAQELRAKQIKLRHDRAAAKIRSLGGKLAGGSSPIAMDGGMMVMPAIAVDFGGDIPVLIEAIEDLRVIEEMPAEIAPDKPVALKALDAALARLADLLPGKVKADAPPEPPVDEPPPAIEAPPAPPIDEAPPATPEAPQAPADEAPAEAPMPPAAEAPIAEPEAEGELPVLPEAPADVAIADAIAIDAFIAGPVFGGGFFIEEGAFPDSGEGLSTALALDSSWSGGDDGLAALRDLPSLVSLSIADAKLTDAALPHIAALPNLQSLSIVNTKFSVPSLLKFRKERPNTRIFARGSAMLGVHADTSGSCVVTGVYHGSGAATAGLQAGDQIVKIDGHKINDFGDLTIAVYAHAPGDKLKVEFLRGGETKSANVELKPRADLEAVRQ